MIQGISDDRWREAGALFNELVELDAASRSERVQRVAESDPELGAMVEALLAGDAIADEVLPLPGFGVAAASEGVGSDALGLAGQTVGRFRVLEQVAWGGMGVVYRAEDTQLQRTVALKFPLLDREVSDIARALSLREARAAGALDHPNVCPIYDVGESDRGTFLVMPAYGGETLKERIARDGAVNASEALKIIEQIAAGLACAHAAGIVHCDIKPGNIMLLPDGSVKILDFGLARATSTESARSLGLVGTVAYMAPEQLRNDPVDARADLWALGVILYEMLAGTRPFVGDDAAQIAGAVTESKPIALAERGISVPDGVGDLVSVLLAPDPAGRMQSATELSRAISEVRTAMDRPVHRQRKLRRFAIIGGAVGTAILASALWLWSRSAPTLMSTHKVAPYDTVVLANFEVAGIDPTNASVFATLVRRDFDDPRGVAIMPENGVRSALERMRRVGDSKVTDSVAREIARRENLRGVLSGRVSPLGSGYAIVLRLVDAESGNTLTSSTTRAAAAGDLLVAFADASQALRRAIGQSPRSGKARQSRPRKPLTTTSLEVARMLWANPRPRSAPEKLAAMRAALRKDPEFAYGWLNTGNMLDWTGYRSALRDTAFTKAYALRDQVTLMERAQISGLYWFNLQRDRRSALAEANQALAVDTTIYAAVPLNMTVWLNDSRQFEETERFGRRIERWKTVNYGVSSALVAAQIAQGKVAAAESSIARRRAAQPGYRGLELELLIALSELRFDSAEALLRIAHPNDALTDWSALHRLRGRLAEARRAEEAHDSSNAASATAAGARFDPAGARALTLAREALWLGQDAAGALAVLDKQWGAVQPIHDTQDRVEGIQAAELYAAAGRTAKADSLLAFFRRGADTLTKRVIFEYALAAQGEIAFARGDFTKAMQLLRASDYAADGLPASPCSVCILPRLARVAERAGWPDSARVLWEDYVHRPSIARLSTDQWFLSTAYSRLAAFAAKRGDSAGAASYSAALARLRASAPRSSH